MTASQAQTLPAPSYGGLTIKGTTNSVVKLGSSTDWLLPTIPCTTNCAFLYSLSPNGYIGLLGASRTLDNPLAGAMGSIGLAGYTINNNTSAVQTGYAGYLEARRSSGTGTTQGLEIDVLNQGSVVDIDPYNMFGTGTTPALWLSSGRPDVTSGAANTTVAIGIINNNTAFRQGLTFQNTSLDNSGGEGMAVVMPSNYGLVWYGSAGTKVARVRSDATTASLGLVFANGQLNFNTVSGTNIGSMDTSGNFTAQGNVSADQSTYLLGNIAGQSLPGDATSKGTTSIGWNRTNGGGESDFVNSKGGGSTGGFNWYQWNGTTATRTGILDQSGNFTAGATINTSGYNVSTLPASPTKGARAYVNDATSCTFLGTLTGGGSTFCPVIYNGSAWVGG